MRLCKQNRKPKKRDDKELRNRHPQRPDQEAQRHFSATAKREPGFLQNENQVRERPREEHAVGEAAQEGPAALLGPATGQSNERNHEEEYG